MGGAAFSSMMRRSTKNRERRGTNIAEEGTRVS
jgi:hypothetical protein